MNYMDDASTFERFFLQKARQQHIPITGALELLPLCNMNCDMCYVRLSRSEMECQGQLRTVDEWILLAQQMQKAGTLFLLLTGGEPLLFPDFKTLYLELRNMGMILTINTNGTLLGESWADFFAEYRPRRINITLYGADAASYNRLCITPRALIRPSAPSVCSANETLMSKSAVASLKRTRMIFQKSCSRRKAWSPRSCRSLYDARRPGTLPSF